MPSKSVTIINTLGLHARATAKLTRLAQNYDSHVEIALDGTAVDGKSVMSVMMLAAHVGTTIEITCNGGDENDALAALVTLVEDGFGELD